MKKREIMEETETKNRQKRLIYLLNLKRIMESKKIIILQLTMIENSQAIPHSEREFRRILDTNYKYSCLISLTKQMTRLHKIHRLSNQIAKRNRINRQKNYFITCIRLVLLTTVQNNGHNNQIQQTFKYMQENLERCVQTKYGASIGRQNPNFMKIIQDKLISDIGIFKSVIETGLNQEDAAFELFLGLYRKDKDIPATPRQQKQARKLAKLAVGVAQDGQNFMLDESLLVTNLNATSPFESRAENAQNQTNAKHTLITQNMESSMPEQEPEAQQMKQQPILQSVQEQNRSQKKPQLVDYTFYQQPPLPFEVLFMLEDFQV